MELNPCPFCKGEEVDIMVSKVGIYVGTYRSYVYCSCGAQGPIISSEDIDPDVMEEIYYDEQDEFIENYMIEKAILKWNER